MGATAGQAQDANASSGPSKGTDSGGGDGATISLQELLGASVRAHEAGQLETAEQAYKTILSAVPDNADALHFLGVLKHQQDNSDDALELIEKAINLRPGDAQQHNNLGKVLHGLERFDDAEEQFRKAVEFDAECADAHANLGIVLQKQTCFTEAIECFEAALEYDPSLFLANKHLAELWLNQTKYKTAEHHLRAYLEQVPDDALCNSDLGHVLQQQGKYKEAEQYFRQAVVIAAESPELRHNLSNIHRLQGEEDNSRELLRQLLTLKPEMWRVEAGFAHNLAKRGLLEQAKVIFRDILELVPDDAEVCHGIASILTTLDQIDEALEIEQRAVEIKPDYAHAYNGIGYAYLLRDEHSLAVDNFKHAISIEPSLIEPYAGLCRALWNLKEYDQAKEYVEIAIGLPGFTPKHVAHFQGVYRGLCDFEGLKKLSEIQEICEHTGIESLPTMFLGLLVFADDKEKVRIFRDLVLRWAEGVEDAAAATVSLPPFKTRGKDEKLRIGFLSSDLRSHSVAKFMSPLFKSYDRDRFEFYCYSPIRAPGDPVQQEFQENVEVYRFVDGRNCQEISQIIHQDGIEILFDLNGFTRSTRIGTLAYRPAPVQMSWLGYPFTCGLKAIDYVVLDRYVNPTDETSLIEEPLIMPEACFCYGRFDAEPIAPELPMDRNGFVTFGTLNNPYKYTPRMLALWAEVMNSVPDSHFLFVRPEARADNFRSNLTKAFGQHGIAADRLSFVNNKGAFKPEEGFKPHFAYYNDIDITLDTAPLTGGTTTCDAIWMGVPVVTLVGDAFHQRISYTDLMQCGLEELCTFSPEEFVERAVRLAGEHDKLLAWRHGLREVMEASPLCDNDRFIYQFQEMLCQVAELHGLR